MKIGDILREEREARNFTLEDIQERTKIQKRYLIAIENNNFDALPGRFYTRAFIKEYAQVLNMDGIKLMDELGDEELAEEKEVAIQYSRLKRTKKAALGKGTGFFSFLPTLIVLLLLIGIGYIAWTLIAEKVQNKEGPGPGAGTEEVENDEFTRNPEPNQTPSDSEKPEDETPEEPEEEEPVIPDPTFEVVEMGTGSSPESTINLLDAPEKVEITLTQTGEGRAYVEIKGEETTYVGEIMELDATPQTFDISAEDKVHLNIGYAPGIEISVNDIVLDYPVEEDKTLPVHQRMWLQLKQAE